MSEEEVLTRPEPPPDARIPYGAGPSRFIDVRLSRTTDPGPGLVNLHGGFWRAENSLEHAGALCHALRAQGISTFNVEYRRVGEEGGGWPGTLEDVRSAYRFLRTAHERFHVDPRRWVVMGHSAGGQLALYLAANDPTVRAVISLAGVLDLRRASALRLGEDAVDRFLGGGPEAVPERYRIADPMELTVAPARQWVLHGTDDALVPVEFAREYVRRKSNPKTAPGRKSEAVELVKFPRAGHFDLIDPGSEAFAHVTAIVRTAVGGRLATSPDNGGSTPRIL